MELIKRPSVTPQAIAIANKYFEFDFDVERVANYFGVDEIEIRNQLKSSDAKEYMKALMLEVGYSNLFRLHKTLDQVIFEKIEEEGFRSKKDIADLLALKSRMLKESSEVLSGKNNGTNVNIINQNISALQELLSYDND